MIRRTIMLLLLLTGPGCATMSTLGTAETLPKGHLEVYAAPELSVSGPVGVSGRAPLPELGLGLRAGVADRIDVGGKVSALVLGNTFSTAAVEAGAKAHLVRGGDVHPFDVALGANAGYRFVRAANADYEVLSVSVPLYFGVDVGRHQVVLGPRVGNQTWLSAGATPVHMPFYGSSVGVAMRLGKYFTIHPEVTVLRSPTALTKTDGTLMLYGGVGIFYRAR